MSLDEIEKKLIEILKTLEGQKRNLLVVLKAIQEQKK
jgi:NADH:ubiquinone oxidoreductase subunit E